jgi:RimJ/RimL family protein N-acetyltransferase
MSAAAAWHGTPEVIAQAGDVVIRRKRLSDFAEDFAWRTDPETSRFDGSPPLDMPFERYIVHAEREASMLDPTRRAFSIDRAGHHIGNIMYYNATMDRESCEIGITVGSDANRGQGVGSLAVVLFLRYIWATTPFRRVVLHTLEWNERARRCFEKAGFAVDARVIRDGQALLRMDTRREWWLMWDGEGRFSALEQRLQLPLPRE